MPAFSLYIKDDLLAAIKAHVAEVKAKSPSSTLSVAAFITGAVRDKLYQNRPRHACVGKEGISWTTALPADDAVRTQVAAAQSHPGLVVYYLPWDCDTSTVVAGAAVPAGSRTEL
jgi:hypothetical protein